MFQTVHFCAQASHLRALGPPKIGSRELWGHSEPLVGPWETLGNFWSIWGSSWRAFGELLERSGESLGAPWEALEQLWESSGRLFLFAGPWPRACQITSLWKRYNEQKLLQLLLFFCFRFHQKVNNFPDIDSEITHSRTTAQKWTQK